MHNNNILVIVALVGGETSENIGIAGIVVDEFVKVVEALGQFTAARAHSCHLTTLGSPTEERINLLHCVNLSCIHT